MTQHGKCVTALRGGAVRTASTILEATVAARHRRHHALVAADSFHGLIADHFQWLPAYGGHILVDEVFNRKLQPSCLTGTPVIHPE